MEMLSDKYGWTPNQIREMDMLDVEEYLKILNDKASIEKKESKKHKR